MSKVKQIQTSIGDLKNFKKVFCVVYTKHAIGQYGFMGTILFGVNTMNDYREFGLDEDDLKIANGLSVGESFEISDLGFGLPCVRIR